MSYPVLLALHLFAVAIFLAGLLTTSALLPGLTGRAEPDAARRAELDRLLVMNRFATTPALVMLWGFGSAMAVEAGWYASGWLQAKVVLVLLLSGWHGRQLRALRLLAADRAPPRASHRALALLGAIVTVIVMLVTTKPF